MTTGVWISDFQLMDMSRLMSCKKILLLLIVDLKVHCSFMYQIALQLNVESSASLLSHPFILIFLTLDFHFPQPCPQGLLRSQACEQALHVGESREVTRDGRAFSRGSFCLTFESLLAGSGFSLENLCKGVFERLVSTGSGLFTFLSSCFAQIFSHCLYMCKETKQYKFYSVKVY